MIKIYDEPSIEEFLDKLKVKNAEEESEIEKSVTVILEDVRRNGDAAITKYTSKYDKVELENFLMSSEEVDEKIRKCDTKLYEVMEKAAKNIYDFHSKQKKQSFFDSQHGIIIGQKVTALQRVALYVPGGTATYPSSVLMNAIPAKIAGVEEIIILTPPKRDGISPAVAAAAKIAGVDKIYTIGGVQAIAAVAFGTKSIPKVDKIVGPGNIYVTTAKKLVYGCIDIDMIAGPSEILIIADEKANAKYIAADLMSQAEHDIMARSILITTSQKLAEDVNTELLSQVKNLSRKSIIEKSINERGAILIVSDIQKAISLANEIAPEHLELAIENAFSHIGDIKNAGSIFIGEYSPEPLGDYFAGTNHVLPTSGTAKFMSPLDVDSFIKKSGFVYYSKEKLLESANDIMLFANSEGLTAHANSIKVRID